MAGKGQPLEAYVHVDTSTAQRQLTDFINTNNGKKITLDVVTNKGAVKNLNAVAKAGKAAQEAVNGQTTKATKAVKNPYEAAVKSATQLERAYQNLADRRAKLQKTISTGKENNLLNTAEIAQYQKQIQLIESKMKQIESSRKALKSVSGMMPKDASQTVSYSQTLKNQSAGLIAETDTILKENQRAAKSFEEIQRAANKAQNKVIGFDKIGNRLSEYFATYGNQIQKNVGLYNQFMTLMNKVQTGGFASVQEANRAFATFRMNARAAGVEVESIGSKLERTFGSRVRSALAGQGVYMIQSALRGIVQNAIEVDTAMTELKKVTDASDAEYSQFLTNASDRAQNLGATLKDVVSATADYARLGYDIPDATKLADSAILYLNVGDDVESMDQATKSLISTMQGLTEDLVKQGELLETPKNLMNYSVVRNNECECLKIIRIGRSAA